MNSSFKFGRNFIVFFVAFLSCESIHSIYLSASGLPEDQLRKILLTSFTDFEPDRAKMALMEFYKFFASNSESAQEHPPPNWNSEENDVLSDMPDLPFHLQSDKNLNMPNLPYRIQNDKNLNMPDLQYHLQNDKNLSTLSKSCIESPSKSFRLKGFRVHDTCPSGFGEKRLPPGTIPLILFELRCLCEGHKCSGGLASCKQIKKLVPVLVTKPDGANYKLDLVPVTVGCVCAQELAPEAGYKKIDSLEY